ncbi:NADH-quinone oxidoreductase subunit J [Prevotella sp. P2-180]|uniref:NADH-quinone oxidoreductase subunit J family protein n=1 Tax=Prevotella sp. P2-180 TaxID=2024224 RepID=UPI000B970F29|nr:NADH-quinone oxidoreductase subunit J [Prevotella sp. P2-180]MDD5783982.1 NADH-quinone oxidoreductase subunit J [Prevotella sp.]MDD6863901.1 NADH-quinone oxidoreductase subunit J [Prevotella sp.]MDY4498905.1 NADH-quinone oxidoreductase subunit J [Prevotella sp.]OYP62691.1 NADH-quinone oxidoreductase subunit J [Prevotella sp. P2-180]
MANIVMFCILAVVILGAAVMSVATKRIMRSVTYLLIVLFGVAGLYFLLDYTFLGAAQIAVYAGGVTMLFIFAIQMVNKRALEGAVERLKAKSIVRGVLLAVVGLVTVLCVLAKNRLIDNVVEATENGEVSMEVIGNALVGSDKFQYVLPFEFISVFLLACIIGGIVVSRKEKEIK